MRCSLLLLAVALLLLVLPFSPLVVGSILAKWPPPSMVEAASRAYLPLVARDYSPGAAARLQPADFQYLGAFRLPAPGLRPKTFEYGGNAIG